MPLTRKRTFILLLFLIVVWGVNWPLSKHALEFCPPLLFGGIRLLIGGLVLLSIALPRWKKLQWTANWPYYFISAVLNIVLYYGLQTVGLQYLPAGLFSAIVFLQPVLLGVFAWLWLGESMYGRKIAGLILGFLGVAVIGAGGLTGTLSPLGIILGLGSALSWALGTVYMKRIGSKVDSLWITTMQVLIGGVVLLVAGTLNETWSAITWNANFIFDTLFISVFVVAAGWMVFFTLVGSGEASRVGSFTFLIPVVSISCSVIFMGEQLTANLILGFIMIVGSIILVNSRKRKKTPDPSPRPPTQLGSSSNS
ncbi:drug/metabolite transporter (DMT)-like permease [Paenibacillus shirakamiensis]|uniref:Drug/metabolite transporter (DMT)-like permease n=1 Tax=Paenibacillus shirakamiensis TaxID=1265935 RepID=A0ABS4JF93_9BACL|nr:DMT family transporter [Paenibacillus shirakamiensis]MBP2000363.1 drug/metabolite transporter (DMT)-like permease [Paenibacillus shirakamiensis]